MAISSDEVNWQVCTPQVAARWPSGNCRKLILEVCMLMPTNVLSHGCFGVLTSTILWPGVRSPNKHVCPSGAALEGKFGQLLDGTYTYIFGLSRCWCRWGEAACRDVLFTTCASWCWMMLNDEERNKGWLLSILNDEWSSNLLWGWALASIICSVRDELRGTPVTSIGRDVLLAILNDSLPKVWNFIRSKTEAKRTK